VVSPVAIQHHTHDHYSATPPSSLAAWLTSSVLSLMESGAFGSSTRKDSPCIDDNCIDSRRLYHSAVLLLRLALLSER
jgi:hypothetical protein